MTARHEGAPGATPAKKVPVKLIAAAVLVALGVIFLLRNRQTVDIRVFTTTISGPLWAVLAGVLALGLLAGVLLARSRTGRGPR